VRLLAQTSRAFNGLGDVGNDALAPAADLVAEEPEAPEGTCADGTLGDDAVLRSLTPRRRLLDHEPALRQVDLQGRVVEIAAIAVLESGREPFEDLPVQPNGVAARAERQPVELDAHR
jgi:hypothetical protein